MSAKIMVATVEHEIKKTEQRISEWCKALETAHASDREEDFRFLLTILTQERHTLATLRLAWITIYKGTP